MRQRELCRSYVIMKDSDNIAGSFYKANSIQLGLQSLMNKVLRNVKKVMKTFLKEFQEISTKIKYKI